MLADRRTDQQKAASGTNGAKTRGPISPEGKRKSARNSFRHGLLAKAIVFEGESSKQFAALLKAFCHELQPRSPIEDLLVQKMAVNQWRQERIWGQEKARASQPRCLPESSPQGSTLQEICQPEPRIATQMNMSEMRYDRQFGRALDRLLRYRAARENPGRQVSETDEKNKNYAEEPGN